MGILHLRNNRFSLSNYHDETKNTANSSNVNNVREMIEAEFAGARQQHQQQHQQQSHPVVAAAGNEMRHPVNVSAAYPQLHHFMGDHFHRGMKGEINKPLLNQQTQTK